MRLVSQSVAVRLRRTAACVVALGLVAVLAPPAPAALTTVTLIIGGKKVAFVVSPYVGPDGQVYGPVDAVRLLGAQYTPDADGTSVTIQGAGGRPFSAPCVPVSGRYCVALQKVALALGASADWQPTTRTLTLRARMEMARQDADALTISTSYPVYYRVSRLDDPRRIFVDLYGLDLAAGPAVIPSSSGGVSSIRSGQLNFNTVRIVIDLKEETAFRIVSAVASNRVRIALMPGRGPSSPAEPAPGGLAPLPVAPPPSVAVRPTPVLPAVPPGSGIRITGVSLKVVSSRLTQIAIETTGPAKYRTETLNDPNRLAFDLAGATLDTRVKTLQAADHPLIKAIRAGILHTGTSWFGRIVLDMTRLVGFTVTTEASHGGSLYLINLQTPFSPPPGDNNLSGKIVVIDPGHGLQDTGAIGLGGAREKDINLAVGLKLRDVLTENGATVYMTRDDDSFLSVSARPQFAIAHNADYFISVHSDESGPANSHSGTTVYYHAQNGVCRRLAEDILARVGEVSGIPAAGVRSDTIRFQTGFGVLRGSTMPAVLVECGYMNSENDLNKLRDDGTQRHIAEGIAAGLRDFIAERANQ